MSAEPIPAADITVDRTGLLCVTLLLRLRKQIEAAEPGTIVHAEGFEIRSHLGDRF
ncbi:hypothetical protein [Streptomyces sp. NPDC096032]|uniref:hypothetical protein n=1 Tax=Streptomyces sp. NPDC096032 TaxID=3366070 RepID=UPI00382B21D0